MEKKKNKFNSDCSIQAGFCFVFAVFGRNGFLFCLLKSVKRHWFGSNSFVCVYVCVSRFRRTVIMSHFNPVVSVIHRSRLLKIRWRNDIYIFCCCCLSLA